MPEIPEDYTHAELWMRYKSQQRKLEAIYKLALDGRLNDNMSVPAETILYILGKAEVIINGF